MQIYLARNKIQAGPYTLKQINDMLDSKEISLDDLVWHEGLNEWKKMGDVTNGQYTYTIEGVIVEKVTTDKVTADTNMESGETKNRLTVDELYGREPTKPKEESELAELEKLINTEGNKTKIIRIGHTKNQSAFKYMLANISSRMIAVFLDQLFLVLCFFPIIIKTDKETLQGLLEAFQSQNIVELTKYLEALPEQMVWVSMALILLTIFIQVLLLIKRGQTLGKLLIGIRILDTKTNKLPSVTNILLLRTVVKSILYGLPTVGYFILMVDAMIMITDKNKQSLHDKLAGTYVAKAKAEQLTVDKDANK